MAEDKGKGEDSRSAEERRADEPVTGLAPGQDPATQSGQGQESGGTTTGASGAEQAASVPSPAASAEPGADDPEAHGAGRESTGGAITSTGTIGGQPIDPEDQNAAVEAGGQPPSGDEEEVAAVREAVAKDAEGGGAPGRGEATATGGEGTAKASGTTREGGRHRGGGKNT